VIGRQDARPASDSRSAGVLGTGDRRDERLRQSAEPVCFYDLISITTALIRIPTVGASAPTTSGRAIGSLAWSPTLLSVAGQFSDDHDERRCCRGEST
jgi:hypothetical protein